MNRRSARRDWAWRVGGIAVSAVALAVVLASVDISAAWRVLAGASLPLLVVVLAVVALQVVVRAWRWRIVLPERPDGEPVAVASAVGPLLVGYLGNATLPARLGEPIRALLVARREGLGVPMAFGATMLERLVDIVTLALIGLLAATWLGAAWWMVAIGAVAGLGGIVALGLLVAFGVTRLADMAARGLQRLRLDQGPRASRLQHVARGFAAGVDRGRHPRRLTAILLISLVAWALDASIFWLVGRSLGIDLGLGHAVLIGAVAVLSTAIPAAPGYVGTFELAATTAAVALGVPQAPALALSILVHVITVIPVALAGAVAVLALGTGLGRLAGQALEVDHEPT